MLETLRMRRRRLGALALPAALLAIGTVGANEAAAQATNPIQAENAKPGDSAWHWSWASPTSIEGYASEVSVAPGGVLRLHVNVPAGPAIRYRVDISRIGWYGGAGGRLIKCHPTCGLSGTAGVVQATRPASGTTGELDAGWKVTDQITIPSDAVSGYYQAELRLLNGPEAGRSRTVPFLVRPAATAAPSSVLVQAPVNTWQAYNMWGGRSLYPHANSFDDPLLPPATRTQAHHVSFNRPYANTYPPFAWESYLVRFLEREGYDLSYLTDVDVDRALAADPRALLEHRLVISAGHAEYWTKLQRDGFDAARAESTNFAFMGSNNSYWQIRYENDRRTIVAYKENADREDPLRGTDVETTRFRDLDRPRPECELVGVQLIPGGFATTPRDYTVAAPAGDPWFAGTGLDPGEVLRSLVGYEWDALQEGCQVPQPTVLFHYEGANGEADADAVRYLTPSGGRVFASGSLQFTWGLDSLGENALPDAGLQQFMRNAMRDLIRPATPRAVTATAALGSVRVDVTPHVDPRRTGIVVYRHPGTGTFTPTDAGAQVICRTSSTSCTDTTAAPGATYRYAAAITDRWGASELAFTAPVLVLG